jgi:dipeptidyl-peptidase-4
MFRPAPLDEGRQYPVLIWVYNGPGAQIVRDEWRTKYVPWMRLLARRGVLVFSMDGRGTSGRGRAWEKPIYGRLTEVELEDQLRGVEYLRSLPYVDGSRIGVFGWSYGGTMVLAGLLLHPGTFRVGVSVAPVSDWRFYDTIYTERYMMRPQDNPEGYQRSALWPHADQLRDPLLLIHGLSDDNVHFRNTSRMLEALIDEGRHVDVMVYPGQSHGISAPSSRRHVFSTITAFLLDHLLN